MRDLQTGARKRYTAHSIGLARLSIAWHFRTHRGAGSTVCLVWVSRWTKVLALLAALVPVPVPVPVLLACLPGWLLCYAYFQQTIPIRAAIVAVVQSVIKVL